MTNAVDFAKVVKRKFMKDLKGSKITIETKEAKQEKSPTRNVLNIEIMLTRNLKSTDIAFSRQSTTAYHFFDNKGEKNFSQIHTLNM